MDHSLLSLVDDLHQVKGNISQIQATLNQILTKAPTKEKYNELIESFSSSSISGDKQLIERLSSLVSSSQLKVAVNLKYLYDNDKLPVLLALSQLNFKTLTNDDPSLEKLLDEINTTSQKYVTSDYPPQLPIIEDQSLLIRIFTDKSFRQPSDFLDSVNQGTCFNSSAHNEKLFLKGKSLLQLIILELIDEMYPNLYEDELDILVGRVLSLEILAKLALGYNLVDSYKYNLSVGISFQEKINLFGKLFVSYIGGLGTVKLVDYVKSYVEAVFHPIISSVKDEQSVVKFSKVQLDFLISKIDGVTLRYVLLEEDPYVVQVLINDEVVSSGTGSTEDAARERAAFEVVQNVEGLQKVMGFVVEDYEDEGGLLKEQQQKQQQHQQHQHQQHQHHQHHQHHQQTQQPQHNQNHEPPYQPKSVPKIPPLFLKQLPPPPSYGYPQPYTSISKPVSSLPKVPNTAAPLPYTPISYNSTPGMPGLPLATPAVSVDPFGVPIIGQSYKVGMENNAKNTLYALLGQHRLTPVYKNAKAGNEFQVSVVVNDQTIGVGYDTNKRFASQKAAMSALGNESGLKGLGVVTNEVGEEFGA